jgi:long-chain acyl-CoA synthetase
MGAAVYGVADSDFDVGADTVGAEPCLGDDLDVKARVFRVQSRHGREGGIGQSGEALWQGPALMPGYWKSPELTTDALTSDGWYRTSDLVRVDAEGHVYVEGRLSGMISRGGGNVSPAEAETLLETHTAVRRTAVVAVDDAVCGQQVVAVVVPQDGDSFDTEDVLAHCRARLPGYKVPSRVVLAEELPVHPATGKADRKRPAAKLRASGSVS